MFFSDLFIPLAPIIVAEAIKFKKWGDYYAIVDWVVNEYKIKGVTKMGIVRLDILNWGTVHGSTNSTDSFKQIEDLKEVKTSDTIGENEGKFYSGKTQSETTNKTKFYRVNDDYIVTSCPPVDKIN